MASDGKSQGSLSGGTFAAERTSQASLTNWLARPRSQRPAMDAGVGGGDEATEEGMGLVRFAVEFGVELAGDEEGMLGQLGDFDEPAVGGVAAEDEAGF